MKYYSQYLRRSPTCSCGGEMGDGLTKDAEALGIKQIDAAQMKASTDALSEADRLFNIARSAQEPVYDNFHLADEKLTEWLGKATGVLSAFFGKRWNRQWIEPGFITPSIAIPPSINDRLALAVRMTAFLTSKPGFEAPNQDVTAAIGAALRKAVVDTQNLALQADANLTDKGTARTAAIDALTSNMRTLIGLLGELLSAADPRWLDFGLEIPAKLATPAAPTGLAVTPNPMLEPANGADPDTTPVILTCDPNPFTTRYRFRMRFLIPGSTFKIIASTTEPMAQIEMPVDTAAEFIVQAVNGNRQSVASAVVVYQPAARAATTLVVEETPSALAVPLPQSNGSNGHASATRVPSPR